MSFVAGAVRDGDQFDAVVQAFDPETFQVYVF
jgi:hypothetical protein